jgi:hypothetical protein
MYAAEFSPVMNSQVVLRMQVAGPQKFSPVSRGVNQHLVPATFEEIQQ